MVDKETLAKIMAHLMANGNVYTPTTILMDAIDIPRKSSIQLHSVLQTLRALDFVELVPGTEVEQKEKMWRATKFYRDIAKQLLSKKST